MIQERDLLKRPQRTLQGNFVKYAWITDQAKDYPVTILCRFMDVSRSCYYDWVSSPKTDREKENEALTEQLKNCLKTVARLMEPVVLKENWLKKAFI